MSGTAGTFQPCLHLVNHVARNMRAKDHDFMKKLMFASLGLGIAVFAFAGANSGLAKGESVTPFHPNHVSGPLAKSTDCFPCTFQNAPQVQVWVNGDDMKNVLSIAKSINSQMVANKDFKGLVVVITEDSKTMAAKLEEASKMKGLDKVGMAYISKKDKAVGNYKINLADDVKNTVFVYKNWKVAEKFVNLKGDEAGLKSLNASIKNVL